MHKVFREVVKLLSLLMHCVRCKAIGLSVYSISVISMTIARTRDLDMYERLIAQQILLSSVCINFGKAMRKG